MSAVDAGAGRPQLSLVVPAYNEEERLGETLAEIDAWSRPSLEVVIVDDGSSDRTATLARDWMRGRRGRVVASPENRGKGHAVRTGALAASGRWVLVSDADLSTPLDQYDRLADAARDRDLDMAIGSRAVRGAHVEVHQNALRERSGKLFNTLVRWSTGLPFRDTQCGFKLMDLARLRPLLEMMQVDGFAWDVELLYLCHRFKLAVAEVPVVWRNDPYTRVRPWRDGPRALADIAAMRWRFRRGGYVPNVSAV